MRFVAGRGAGKRLDPHRLGHHDGVMNDFNPDAAPRAELGPPEDGDGLDPGPISAVLTGRSDLQRSSRVATPAGVFAVPSAPSCPPRPEDGPAAIVLRI